jgi:hypothetical protein
VLCVGPSIMIQVMHTDSIEPPGLQGWSESLGDIFIQIESYE